MMHDSIRPRVLKRILTALVVTLLVGGASESLAIPVTAPTGLNVGDQFRLAFVTSMTRDATSGNIADYDAFVTAAANAVPELAALGTTWTAIGSTSTVDARDNTGTNPGSGVGVRIFLTNDTLLAADNADLWDGSIAVPLQYDENGALVTGGVWTGTIWDGKAYPAYFLGPPYNTAIGDTSATDIGWIATALAVPSGQAHVFAMSGVLTFIPEPGTATLLTLGLVGLAAVRRRG